MNRFVFGVLVLWALMPRALADVQSAIDSYHAGDFQAALEELQTLAQQNDPFAQYALGLMYAEGAGTPRDRTEAAKWYAEAAKLGHARSQHNLAVSYYTGIGVPHDYRLAAEWYRKSAEQGDSRAQNILGYMYDIGRGVEADPEQAAFWYKLSAAAGNINAQINLANSYRRGRGVERDKQKAREWYAKVFDDLFTEDPMALWVVNRFGRTSPAYQVDGTNVCLRSNPVWQLIGPTSIRFLDRCPDSIAK